MIITMNEWVHWTARTDGWIAVVLEHIPSQHLLGLHRKISTKFTITKREKVWRERDAVLLAKASMAIAIKIKALKIQYDLRSGCWPSIQLTCDLFLIFNLSPCPFTLHTLSLFSFIVLIPSQLIKIMLKYVQSITRNSYKLQIYLNTNWNSNKIMQQQSYWCWRWRCSWCWRCCMLMDWLRIIVNIN